MSSSIGHRPRLGRPWRSRRSKAPQLAAAAQPAAALEPTGAVEPTASVARQEAEPSKDGRFLVKDLNFGQTVEGIVKHVNNMGVKVDIGIRGKTGLIEIGEWLEDGGFPLDFQAAKGMVGTRISARVLRIRGVDVYLTRRSGSLERPELKRGQNKKEDILAYADVSPSQWFAGQVVGMAPWGIYVSFRQWPAGRVQGLVHKSSFTDGFASEVSVGQHVRVRVVGIDAAKPSIALSMREPE